MTIGTVSTLRRRSSNLSYRRHRRRAESWEVELARHTWFWRLEAIDELVDKRIALDGWERVWSALPVELGAFVPSTLDDGRLSI